MSTKTPNIPIEYTISFKFDSFLWLPAKSASTTLSWIFRYFDFQRYKLDNNQFTPINNQTIHLASVMNFPPNHEKFSFICSIRNPYESIFSYYKMAYSNHKEFGNRNNSQNFVNHILEDYNSLLTRHLLLIEKRIPDYIIRKENLYEDISKIPFVRDSNIYQCGVVEEMCQKKLNISSDLTFENFFSDEQIQKINSMYYKIFELGNYEKL